MKSVEMKNVILYLDKMSGEMEDILLSYCPNNLEIKFLNPVRGKQGTLEEAKYLIASYYAVTKDVIDRAPALKMIQRTGVGYDAIDVNYANEKDILVTIAPGTNAASVAELVILFMIALSRKLLIVDKTAKEGKWETWTYRHNSYEISGKTVGVIGSGTIGREVIKRLNPFGVNVVYYDAYRLDQKTEDDLKATYCSLDELFAKSDIVTIHVPWLESTKGLIGEKQLSAMKKGSFLINTARGPIVDQHAMLEALKSGRLAGAGLDVFDPEPFTADSEILKFSNVITTPHIGGGTVDSYRRVFNFCIENIQRMERNGNPTNVVNGVKQP